MGGEKGVEGVTLAINSRLIEQTGVQEVADESECDFIEYKG